MFPWAKFSVPLIIALQLVIFLFINFGPLSSKNEITGINVFSLKHFHKKEKIVDSEPTGKHIEGSFFSKIFPNPTPYEMIRDPVTLRQSYIPRLEISCFVYDPDHLNIIIRDADKPRYEVPNEEPYFYPKNPQYLDIKDSNFEFVPQVNPFDIIIRRKSTQEIIFRLTDRLVYTDLYQEFSFFTPTKEIYGLGMRLSPLQFRPGIYTLFLLDRSGLIDHGVPGFNGQGHHSMYLMKEQSGNYHTFFLRNVNFGEVTIYPGNKLKWQLTGGVLDFNFFLGDTPESAIDKYHRYLDGWALPALWHLGYHQNKWAGYRDLDELRGVIEGFKAKNIPLESLWTDTEHMKDNNNFSIDEEKFPLDKVRELFESNRMRWIPLFNAHISLPLIPPASEYPNIEALYMKDSLNELCDGMFLWGDVIFMDFLNPICEPFWDKMIWETDKKWDLSGLWIDANEISNLEKRERPSSKALDVYRKYYHLPFYPGIQNLYELQVVNLDCIHYNGQEEYNMRVFNALFQSKYSYESLKKKFPYPFVLGRATMPGGGKYSFTWIPDIWSTWDHLQVSTAVLLTYGIFGYGVSGVDICGFISAARVEGELCARWHQIATFYPFARNSHVVDFDKLNNYQEPYLFTGVSYDAIYASIKLRYSILKYFYALFFTRQSHGEERKIGALLRPLFYDYHNDTTLPPYGHFVHETQVLLGEAIMIATITRPGVSEIDVYFPNQRWFDLRNYEEVPMRGGFLKISGALTELLPYFIRGGNILLKQDVEGVVRTEDLSNTFTLIVGLSDIKKKGSIRKSYAEAKVLGISSYEEQYTFDHCTKNNCLLSVSVIYENNGVESSVTLKANEVHPNSYIDPIQVDEILVMGIPRDLLGGVSKARLENDKNVEVELDIWENKNINLRFPELDVKKDSHYKFVLF